MQVYEILIIIAAILFVILIFSREIYKKIHNINDECNCCKKHKNKMLSQIRKELDKELGK